MPCENQTTPLRDEALGFWIASQRIRLTTDSEARADALDDLDVLSMFTKSPLIRERCGDVLFAHCECASCGGTGYSLGTCRSCASSA